MKIEIPNDHECPDNSQLILVLTGDSRNIKNKLKEILEQFDDSYGKPRQGTCIDYRLTTTVITPIWNGEPY